ncbi:EAL domain-containing protein [Spirulina major]|uniref:EAL domain-containing protein n=1 Tax=Spirulina major TaxID=270636 RepID=UPI000934D01E|nr:EAL domain-containing protein [Spirulina major]
MKQHQATALQRWQPFLSGTIATLLVAGLQLLGWVEPFEGLAYITLFRLRGTQAWDDRIVVVGIDEAGMDVLEAADWSRRPYGELLEILAQAPAEVVGFDLLFEQATADDGMFAAAMQGDPAVVLGASWDSTGAFVQPPSPLLEAATSIGYITKFADYQGVTRKGSITRQSRPSLSYAIARTRPDLPPLPNPLPNLTWINWAAPMDTIPTYSLAAILKGDVDPAVFRDKIVLVGTTAAGIDPIRTPYDTAQPTHGIYVHAAMLSNLLQGNTLRVLAQHPWGRQWWVYAVLGLGLSGAIATRAHRWQLLSGVMLGGAIVLVGVGSLAVAVLVPVVPPLLIVGLTTGLSSIYKETRLTQRLTHQTRHDTVTGLPNRASFLATLTPLIQTHQTFALFFFDIDRFSSINTHHGDRIGDELLIQVVHRIQQAMAPIAHPQLARVGADELMLLVPAPPLLTSETRRAQALQTAHHLDQALRQGYVLSTETLYCTVSIGIVLSWESCPEADTLLHYAETAMYQARIQSKRNYALFNVQLHQGAIALWQLESDLRQSLQNSSISSQDSDLLKQGFYLNYQPIVDLKTGHIAGFEALVRWHHPTRGQLSPLEFIPLAEETGLITLLGQWVLYKACYQLRTWQMLFPEYQTLIMTVNLSPIQLLRPEVLTQIRSILLATGLQGSCLKLEITESSLMSNGNRAIALLEQLRQLGVQLSLDDFGIGYSSLSRLRHLPINTLKIDRSFVQNLSLEPENREIIKTMLDLGHQLKLDVVVEGIETPEQLEILRELHCDYGQGYLFAKPLAAAAVESLLATDPAW